MKFKQVNMIKVRDWDDLVVKVYGKPYSFQQQDGCKERGTFEFKVPFWDAEEYDSENETVPEEANAGEMSVSFKAWLERDPEQKIPEECGRNFTDMWWKRNFYPAVEMLVNDLHNKGELPAGEYCINIDW